MSSRFHKFSLKICFFHAEPTPLPREVQNQNILEAAMKITVIYGTMRKEKSSTWQIAQQFIGRLSENDSVKEFYLPAAMPNFCRSCWQCFEDYTKYPDYSYLAPILEANTGGRTARVYLSCLCLSRHRANEGVFRSFRLPMDGTSAPARTVL